MPKHVDCFTFSKPKMTSGTCASHIQISRADHFGYIYFHKRYILAQLWAFPNPYSFLINLVSHCLFYLEIANHINSRIGVEMQKLQEEK